MDADPLLATADACLLAPFDLESRKLAAVFGALAARRLDYADLYFQYTRSEGWSLEEGIVKSGSFTIEQGVGVRAIAGEKTAFAYSDEISFAALQDAARATRAIAAAGGGAQGQGRAQAHAPRGATSRSIRSPRWMRTKVALLEKLERCAARADPRVTQVMAHLGGEYEVVLISRSDGVLAADVRPLVRLSVQVIAEQDGRREMGYAGGGGRTDYAHFTDAVLEEYAQQAVEPGARQPGVAPGARGHHDRGARAGLARHPAARGDRPRPGGRLQPQGQLGLLRPHRRARRGARRHRGRRRHAARPARLAHRRRRGQSDAAHRADRGRHPARLHAGQPERAPDEDAAHRQRPARILRAPDRCRA